MHNGPRKTFWDRYSEPPPYHSLEELTLENLPKIRKELLRKVNEYAKKRAELRDKDDYPSDQLLELWEREAHAWHFMPPTNEYGEKRAEKAKQAAVDRVRAKREGTR